MSTLPPNPLQELHAFLRDHGPLTGGEAENLAQISDVVHHLLTRLKMIRLAFDLSTESGLGALDVLITSGEELRTELTVVLAPLGTQDATE